MAPLEVILPRIPAIACANLRSPDLSRAVVLWIEFKHVVQRRRCTVVASGEIAAAR
jgi:hypothetical protein